MDASLGHFPDEWGDLVEAEREFSRACVDLEMAQSKTAASVAVTIGGNMFHLPTTYRQAIYDQTIDALSDEAERRRSAFRACLRALLEKTGD